MNTVKLTANATAPQREILQFLLTMTYQIKCITNLSKDKLEIEVFDENKIKQFLSIDFHQLITKTVQL